MGKGPKVKCKLCGDIIQSKHRWDMTWCKCEKIAIDGGDHYVKLSGDLDNMEMLEEEE